VDYVGSLKVETPARVMGRAAEGGRASSDCEGHYAPIAADLARSFLRESAPRARRTAERQEWKEIHEAGTRASGRLQLLTDLQRSHQL
jgi:hypothetical protein